MRTLTVFISCFLLNSCRGAIWKTEDAYIIDDLPDEEIESTTIEPSNSCVSSKGASGLCMPIRECNPLYDFFANYEDDKNIEILEGIQQYVNGSDLESCLPPPPTADEDTVKSGNISASLENYVCCTSLKYGNVKSIDFEDYLLKDPPSNETLPEIPPSPANTSEPWKIVNGMSARAGEFPFAIAIIQNNRQVCGGSLLASNWVLSAAHCFDRFTSSAVRSLVIKVGDHDISSYQDANHQDVTVHKLFLHPGFFRQQGFFRDDVALIKLRTPVTQAPNIRTIQLHSGSPDISQNVQATVCGWGKTCGGACRQSSVMRKTTVGIVPNGECGRRYAGTAAPPITQNMVCAGGAGGDACNGDSGGPLVIYSGQQTYQIGIVSWGIGCGQYPGVYTRVSNFRRWIAKHMQRA